MMKPSLRVLTNRRIVTWISKLQAFKGQFFPAIEWVNFLKIVLFGAVTCLKSSPMEFGHSLHQCL
jgi:hypothetical protein